MKEYTDNAFGGLGIGSTVLNKGWNQVKNNKIHVVPFVYALLSKELVDIIETSTSFKLDKFCWYSFADNYIFSHSTDVYDKDKQDIFPGEMSHSNKHVKVLYEKAHGLIGPYCSWNEDLKVGFLDFESNYGYFIKCK